MYSSSDITDKQIGRNVCSFHTIYILVCFFQRPKLLFCPGNATCGDIFFQRRLLKDGTRRPENRHITNCICPGTDGCNFDDDHTIFQSTTHR